MYGVQTALGPLQDAVVIGAWLGAQHRPLLEVEAVGTVEAVAALAARADEQCRLAATSWPSAWVRAQADAVRPWIG
jgi:hypothetical protein